MTENLNTATDAIIVEETDNHVAMAKVLSEVIKNETKPKQKNLIKIMIKRMKRKYH